MNTFERLIFSGDKTSQELPLTKEAIRVAASEKARGLFVKHAIQEESFIGEVYDEAMVRGHLEEVARLDALFDQEQQQTHENAPGSSKAEVKQYGDILEAVIFDSIRKYEWFGEGVSPLKTSKFDDYKNGVDLIVDLEHSKTPLALAVDVTFGFQGMKKKVGNILNKIDEGKLGFVRYYRSEDGSIEGKLNNLAKVVVGVEMDTVQKLAEYWTQEQDEALRAHYAQTLILSEIALQLKEYARYAEHKAEQAEIQRNTDMKRKYERIAAVYRSDLDKISEILDQKPDDDMDNADRVYDCLSRVVKEEIGERKRRVE